MPELPDITVYLEALERRVVGQVLEKLRIVDVFVLRTALPPIDSLVGKRVVGLRRLGKRIVFGFEGDRWLVLHLMIAGRLQWTPAVAGVADPGPAATAPGPGSASPATKKATRAVTPMAHLKVRNALAHFVFATGTLTLTEAGTKHRASLHMVANASGLVLHDRGGLDVLACTLAEFGAALTRENHTLKRTLTDPRLFSGIGNAYSTKSCTPRSCRRLP